MDAHGWDERYRATELLWSVEPNQWVRQHTEDLPPGTALDLASGEGRNALWLAGLGWHVTAVDFSAVAVEKAKTLASRSTLDVGDRIQWIVDDVVTYVPPDQFDLVLVVYLQVAAAQRTAVLRTAAAALAPGGRLLVVGHHTDNLQHGIGGPQDPAVLYTEDDIRTDLDALPGLTFPIAQRVERWVAGESTPALDVLVEALRADA